MTTRQQAKWCGAGLTIGIVAYCATLLFGQTARVGPLASLDSTNNNYRQGRFGELCVQPTGDVNKERVRRGTLYFAAQQGTGTAPGTTLSTTAHLVVYNPQSSGVLITIVQSRSQYVSGTLGTGNMFHCVNTSTTQTAPSGGTLLTNTPALAGNANTSVAAVRVGATVVQPVIVMPMQYLAPELATSVTAPQNNVEVLQDMIQLLPGTSYQIQSIAAAGTSPLMNPGVVWEESPLLNGQP